MESDYQTMHDKGACGTEYIHASALKRAVRHNREGVEIIVLVTGKLLYYYCWLKSSGLGTRGMRLMGCFGNAGHSVILSLAYTKLVCVSNFVSGLAATFLCLAISCDTASHAFRNLFDNPL